MSSLVHVAIHANQFPEQVQRDLMDSLRTRRVNHKFLYDSVKKTQQWLALHQAFSPSRTDVDCAATYDRSFVAAAARVESGRVHLIGLGRNILRLCRILEQIGGRRGVEPLCGVYGPACGPAIRERLEREDYRAVGFHGAVRVGTLGLADVRRYGDPAQLFYNVNTAEELAEAEAMWRQRA